MTAPELEGENLQAAGREEEGEEEEEEGGEPWYPDTAIHLQHVGGDRCVQDTYSYHPPK